MPVIRQVWFLRASAVMALALCSLFVLGVYESQVFQSMPTPGPNEFVLDGPRPGPPAVNYVAVAVLLAGAAWALWKSRALLLCLGWLAILGVGLFAAWSNRAEFAQLHLGLRDILAESVRETWWIFLGLLLAIIGSAKSGWRLGRNAG